MSAADVFQGRTAIVTGGASGIGRQIGEELARRGGRVVLADIDGEAVSAVAASVSSTAGPGASVVGRELDVRDRAAFRRLVDEVVDRDGALDYLFNNAGISIGGPTEELTGEHWDRIIDVNLRGVVNGVLAAYPQMIEQGHGHIVNTASAAGLVATPLAVPYASTKHAVVGLSTGMRPEAAAHGVRVSVLCPGAVETAILDRPPPDGLPPTPSATVTAREYLTRMRQQPMAVEPFVRAALRGVERNKAIIVVPFSANALWYVFRVSPGAVDRIWSSLLPGVVRDLVHPASTAVEGEPSRKP